MERFVESPNLPQGRVKKLILGEKYQNVLNMPLIAQNIEPIWLKCNENVDKRLSGHCDLMAMHLGNSILVVQDGTEINYELINNAEKETINKQK